MTPIYVTRPQPLIIQPITPDLLLDLVLSDKERERETLLIRLGQVEDFLILYGRLKYRTKEPRER